jgi:tRNA-2-methylthio-N6-dimethylallyladenosine synthase
MNVADSAKLEAVLAAAGYVPIQQFNNSTIQQLDLILVNTCVVRQTAEDRAAWYITSLKNAKQENPKLKIILCGCLVSEPGRDVKKQFPHVDLFLPPNSSKELAQYLNSSYVPRPTSFVPRPSSFVTIMTGCDNYCSYCVVPYVRGREQSRPMPEVLAEIKGLLEQGITDITLLGQNVNSYKYNLALLLREIHSFSIFNFSFLIKFLTSHPKDMSDEIIETVAELPFVVKEFVMPLQSGDDEILRAMNRGYTFDYYLNRVKKIRQLMPDAHLITDLIVGFPGETEEQFEKTIQALELCRFNDVHMFVYSERPMIAAAKLPNQVPEEVKQERLQRLIQANRELLC